MHCSGCALIMISALAILILIPIRHPPGSDSDSDYDPGASLPQPARSSGSTPCRMMLGPKWRWRCGACCCPRSPKQMKQMKRLRPPLLPGCRTAAWRPPPGPPEHEEDARTGRAGGATL